MTIDNQTALQKTLHFFLTKIVIGIAVIVTSVALTEWLCRLLLDKTQLTDNTKSIIVAVLDSAIAVLTYILLFKAYEKRRIKELSTSSFGTNAVIGFVTGLVLQSLFIAVIYIAATYSITRVNPLSTLVPSFSIALSAGFVAEILIIGVLFRLLEQQLGTTISLLLFIFLFAILHINGKGATLLSVCATGVQAGFMLPAAYIFSRSLWLPIFLHFNWDFAEPGIFGAINSSTSITEGWFTSKISGAALITGGQTGPQNSLQSLILCLITGALFLLLAKRKNNFIKPGWRMSSPKRLLNS
ncbi:MAG: CPBP family intramembrane glutamic endopeptidase [Ginsengibacter sp.]